MAWPDDRDLPIEVEASFGADVTADPGTWSWTDLSARLRAEPIRIRAGRSSGAGMVSPSTCSLVLDNPDGALTPAHPMSSYWPDVTLGTPVRVRLRRVEDPFDRTEPVGWGTAPSGQVWSGYGAGGTVQPGDQAVSGGRAHQSVPIAAAYRTSWLPDLSLLDCEVHLSGVSLPFSDVTGGPVEPGNILLRAQSLTEYYLARVEITTAEAVICRLYGPTGALLASATAPGLTHTAAQTLEVVAGIVGDRLSMKVWPTGSSEPAGWTVTAIDGTLTLPGGIGVRTGVAAGNTNTKPITASYSAVTVRVDRFAGFADQWEPKFSPTTTPGQADSYVNITASGLLRRLGQGSPAPRSPLRRTIGASNPIAYWPAEDGRSASQAGSAVSGVPAATVTNAVEFTTVEDLALSTTTLRYGTQKLVDLAAGGSITAIVPAGPATGWTVAVAMLIDPIAYPADVVVLEWTTPGGTYDRWQIVATKAWTGPEGDWTEQLVAYPASGDPAVRLWIGIGVSSGFNIRTASAEQVGGNIVTRFNGRSGTVSIAGTLAPVATVKVNATGTSSAAPMPSGHLVVWPHSELPADIAPAGSSYYKEPATVRLARLCAEEGIPLTMQAVDDIMVTQMGWQPAGTLLELCRQCVDADLGVLYERGFGLGYIPRQYRYNSPVAMTVDLATYRVSRGGGRDVVSPVLDDQGMVNELTVSRTDGSSVVVADLASQKRHGTYPDEVELNLADDSQLADQASWRLHVAGGTRDA